LIELLHQLRVVFISEFEENTMGILMLNLVGFKKVDIMAANECSLKMAL